MDHNKLWKILQQMGIPDHFTCLLRNLYAGQEATVRTGHVTMDCFQTGKGMHQGCILSPSYLTSMQNTSCEMPGWTKHKLESRLPGEISITSDTQMKPPLWQKVKSLSRVRLFATPWTVAYQAPLSMGFSRQEYWSGLPFPSPGELPNSGIEPQSPAL